MPKTKTLPSPKEAPTITLATQDFVDSLNASWQKHFDQETELNLSLKKQCDHHLKDLDAVINNQTRFILALGVALCLVLVVLIMIAYALLLVASRGAISSTQASLLIIARHAVA